MQPTAGSFTLPQPLLGERSGVGDVVDSTRIHQELDASPAVSGGLVWHTLPPDAGDSASLVERQGIDRIFIPFGRAGSNRLIP